MQVRIIDSQPGGPAEAHDWEFDGPSIILRELIRRKVNREVEQFNRERPEVYHGLVQPEESEISAGGRQEDNRSSILRQLG